MVGLLPNKTDIVGRRSKLPNREGKSDIVELTKSNQIEDDSNQKKTNGRQTLQKSVRASKTLK